MAKVMPLNAPDARKMKRLGFLAEKITAPDDFDRIGDTEIEQLFGGTG